MDLYRLLHADRYESGLFCDATEGFNFRSDRKTVICYREKRVIYLAEKLRLIYQSMFGSLIMDWDSCLEPETDIISVRLVNIMEIMNDNMRTCTAGE